MKNDPRPDWLMPSANGRQAPTEAEVLSALSCDEPGEREFRILISPAAQLQIEAMAQKALHLTRGHFGRTISLYAPLYVANYCPNGCVYCGFASDRQQPRNHLSIEEVEAELEALHALGIEEVLLLTGGRTPQADLDYLLTCVKAAAARFANVKVETFPMATEEYARLAKAGCTGLTLYQETYDPEAYEALHRWGPKTDYRNRLQAVDRALEAGLRTVGIGVLLGIAEPRADLTSVYLHSRYLQRQYWQAGVSISFPRICSQTGEYTPAFPVDETFLAQAVWAFRICLPDVPLVLSTRESASFRDAMAGVGINKMSVASRTSVGGYFHEAADSRQFDITDDRDVPTFCAMLRDKQLEPVFKNWDAVYR